MARLHFGRRGSDATRRVVVGLAAFAIAAMALDAIPATSGVIEPLRQTVGSVLGPSESVAHAATRPLRSLGAYTESNAKLRGDVARLSSQNSQLRSKADLADLNRARLSELEGLNKAANQSGNTLVPAHVIGMGPTQSFSRTVTLDVGSKNGIHKDMTVLNKDGLVGRVIAATSKTATVLLIVDTDSVVGGRLGSSLEIGFIKGRGSVSNTGRLDLAMVDDSVTPSVDDLVVTWGSKNNVPYVAGIPVGKVESVYSTPGELGKHAVVAPLVDFTALDVVGIVVPKKHEGSSGQEAHQ